MRLAHSVRLLLAGVATITSAQAAALITITRDTTEARPGEVIVVPFQEIHRVMPEARMFHFVVKNVATGVVTPSQVTNHEHDHGGVSYDDLVFQHDLAAGDTRATFRIEPTSAPVAPYPARVSARYVPERYEDFAWENDRIARRAYGLTLNTPAAGKSRLSSSGIDIWAKRVPYPIVDRWYLKGHDQFHVDDGEGMDLYSVGTSRGCGGTGIWDGAKLHVSENFSQWRVLANGPIRAVFELSYDTWQAGALRVTETKHVTVDAGRQFDRIESTYTIDGGDGSATVAIGIAKPIKATLRGVTRGANDTSMSVWATQGDNGDLGCGIILLPNSMPTSYVEDDQNFLLLARIRSGETVSYLAGAGWDRGGHIASREAWEQQIEAHARRAATPVTVSVSATKD